MKKYKALFMKIGQSKKIGSNCENYVLEAPTVDLSRCYEGFELTVLWMQNYRPFDLKEVIERVEPEIIIYIIPSERLETGYNEIVFPLNADAYLEIPRVIYSNCDKISPLSSAGIMVGENLRASANFSSAIVDGEFDWLPFPSYYFPQSLLLDTADFKDYQLPKEFCVGMFGAGYVGSGFYPWRTAISEKLLGNFPAVYFPPVYNKLKEHMNYPRVFRADYSKMINRCQFGVACGTAAKTVLAKHFEIPASGSCLLTEDSFFLRQHGFVDGENCICVTPENVLEKMEYYLTNISELQRITENGYDFVHKTWLAPERVNILYSWLELWKTLKQGEKIVQTEINSLRVVKDSDTETDILQRGEDPISDSWRTGFHYLQQGDISSAKSNFSRTLACVDYEPLGRLGMALVSLFSKNPVLCLKYIEATFIHEQRQGGMGNLHDPVDIAYYIIASLCSGDVARGYDVSCNWRHHTHNALHAARIIAAAAAGKEFDSLSEQKAVKVHSRCPVVISSVEGWLNHFKDVFKIYGISM